MGSREAPGFAYGALVSIFEPEQDENGRVSLYQASSQQIQQLQHSNAGMRVISRRQRTWVGRQRGVSLTLQGRSPVRGENERDWLVSTLRPDGTLWYIVFVAALETVDNNQALLRQLVTVALTKYETGQGLQQDVLLSQLELSKLLDREIQLQAIRRNQAIQLNILMDRSANDIVLLADTVSKAMPNLPDDDALYRRAESARPLLRQTKTRIDAARTRLDLAKRDYYPDIKIGVNYGFRTGDNAPPRGGSRSDFVSVMVGVKIPLYAGDKQSKAVAQKSHELQQNRFALVDKKSLVMGAISSAATDYQRAREQFSLYESGIVPQARQTVESMLAGYQVSAVDFLNLVRSQITLLNYELRYWRALSDSKQALARLEAAVGGKPIHE